MAEYQLLSKANLLQHEPYEGPTGHEQAGIALFNWFLLLMSIGYFGVYYRDEHFAADNVENICFEHWSWYVTNGVQTFFCAALGMMGAYPGYAVLKYTSGLGNDGPGSRLESFYINATMGMVLGIPMMALIDHFMFIFSWIVMIFCWMPWPQIQVFTSGLSCLCGLYMALWIPTNIASKVNDLGPFILCGAFTACSFIRLFASDDTIGFTGTSKTILIIFNYLSLFLVILLSIRGVLRADRAKHSIALAKKICSDLGEGPVWAVWPKGKHFPSGWWFEPPPWGSSSEGWPFDSWPSGPNSANPPSDMIYAAAEEMKREMPFFFSLKLILGFLLSIILGFLFAIVQWGESSC